MPQVYVQQKMATNGQPPVISCNIFYWGIIYPTTKVRHVINNTTMKYKCILFINVCYDFFKIIDLQGHGIKNLPLRHIQETLQEFFGTNNCGEVNRETLYRSYKREERLQYLEICVQSPLVSHKFAINE